MFTGLIEEIGELISRTRQGNAGKLTVKTHLPLSEFACGDSIAVNGACLTVEEIQSGQQYLVFHTLSETLDRTNLGSLKPGSAVNLERALKMGARLGGHLVSGHVDATAKISNIQKRRDDIVLTVQMPHELQPLIIPKGSIAIDGISLTIADFSAVSFSVHIIPHTWQATNLAGREKGDSVNLEADMIGKYIWHQQQLASAPPPISMTSLADAGFLTRDS